MGMIKEREIFDIDEFTNSKEDLFAVLLYVPSQQLWSWRDSHFTKSHFSWASLNKQLTSTSCTYFPL